MFPIKDSVPSYSVSVLTHALIFVNEIVFGILLVGVAFKLRRYGKVTVTMMAARV